MCDLCGRNTQLLNSSWAKTFCYVRTSEGLEIWYGKGLQGEHARLFALTADELEELLGFVRMTLAKQRILYGAAGPGRESIEGWLIEKNYHAKVQNYMCHVLDHLELGHLCTNPDRLEPLGTGYSMAG